jgi:predicted transcriptional regulator
VFHTGSAGVGLDLPDGAAADTRSVVAATAQEPIALASGEPARPVDTATAVGPGEATLAFPSGRWASLFVAADRIEAVVSGDGRLDRAAAGDALEPMLPWPAPPLGTLPAFPHHASGDAATLVHGGGDAAGRLHLAATGLRRLEWYNATARCSMACPDGPAYQAWTVPGTHGDRVELRNSTALDARGGTVAVDGAVDAFVLGGRGLEVAVDGWVRLPQVALDGCAECGSGRTLRLDGDGLALHALAPQGGQAGRLSGRLEAPAALAALDEDRDVSLAAAVAGAAAGGGLAVAAALALRALGALRVRASGPETEGFGHTRRDGLFDLVAGEPGLTFREVERRLGWGNGVTRHHLDILVQQGHLVARRHLNTVRYFENHGRFDADWQAVVHRRDPGSRWLLEVLRLAPRTQREVVELAEQIGWSRSATQRRLARLVDDGLLATQPDGNGRRYCLTPAQPPARGWLGRRGPAPAAAAPAALARPGGTTAP